MFRTKPQLQTEPAPAPAPAAPLTLPEQFAQAKIALKNAEAHCSQLDQEFRDRAIKRENAARIFKICLKKVIQLEEEIEKIHAGGNTEPVVLAGGSVLR